MTTKLIVPWVKDKSSAVPDSTTADKMMFVEDEDVLLNGEDGLFYFGTVARVVNAEEKCLVQFMDDTEKWAHFRNLRKVKNQEKNTISCVQCKNHQTSQGNQICVCHYCSRGYHQTCHDPPIPIEFASEEQMKWMCTRCGEVMQKKEWGRSAVATAVNRKTLQTSQNNNTQLGRRKSLPYDLSALKWDSLHQINVEGKYCYCGRNGEWFRRMLQCCQCSQWFHGECISVIKNVLLLGDRFFLFRCSVCNGGEEKLQRLSDELTLTDMAHLALFNLTVDTTQKYYDLDKHVIPFLGRHWEYFSPCEEISSMTLTEKRNKILAAFWQFKNRFICGRENKQKKTMWGLRNRLPPDFPVTLSSQSQKTLQLWTQSKASCSSVPGKKRTRSSLEDKFPPGPELESAKLQRSKLRVRQQQTPTQQRVTSEESLCDESSDDHPKLKTSISAATRTTPAGAIQTNKRKRVEVGGSCSNMSTTTSSSHLATPVESGDERGTLEVFIPPPKDFQGINNPFSYPSGLCSINPYLSVVRPLKNKRLSEKDIRITKTGEVKRKRFVRKWKRSQTADLFHHSCEAGFPYLPQRDSSKDSVLSYFGVADRIARGEKYSVHARRIPPHGLAQYLIQWETESNAAT